MRKDENINYSFNYWDEEWTNLKYSMVYGLEGD